MMNQLGRLKQMPCIDGKNRMVLGQIGNVADIVDNAAGQVNIIRQVLLNSQRQLDQLGSFRSSLLCGSSDSYQLLQSSQLAI